MLAIMNRLRVGLFLVAAALVAGFSPRPATAADTPAKGPAREESWNVIYLSGQRIGYSQSIIETVVQDGMPVVKTSSVTNMTIKRFGQSLVMKQSLTTEETPTGELLRFRLEMANPPAASQVTRTRLGCLRSN